MFNFSFGGPGGGFPGGMPHSHGGGGRGGGGGGRQAEVDNSKFYELLGTTKGANDAEIKKAFRKAAMTHHPDKGGDPEKFKEISKVRDLSLSSPLPRLLPPAGSRIERSHSHTSALRRAHSRTASAAA
jgi:hypothetical protein